MHSLTEVSVAEIKLTCVGVIEVLMAKETSSAPLLFFITYLALASLRFAGRGGLTLGVGGGTLTGNVGCLASSEGAVPGQDVQTQSVSEYFLSLVALNGVAE